MNIFDFFQDLGSNAWLYGGTFIIMLSILVFVHEWGHYIVARMCGIKVEVFSIGFGKEIAGFNDKNGTRWKFSLVPLGGYVKLFGDVDPASAQHQEEVEDQSTGDLRPLTAEEREMAFFAKPVSQRAAVVFAGPAINYIFAIIVLTGLFVFSGQPVTPPTAAAIMGGSSADQNGFQPHDRILSIDGKKIRDFENIRREMMIALDEEKHFVVERNGEKVDIYAKPERLEQEDRFGFKHSRGLLGLISPRHAIDINTITKIDGRAYSDVEAVRKALSQRLGRTFDITVQWGEKTDTLAIQPLPEFNEALTSAEESEEKNLLFVADTEGNVLMNYSPGEALKYAAIESWEVTRGTLEALWQMVVGTRSASELGGVIRIGALAGDVAQQGLIALLLFTAMLSINLGLINLFPIPLLDGGHLVFYAFEALLGRPVPDQIQEYAFRFGLAFLVCIMVYANLNDLMQLIL